MLRNAGKRRSLRKLSPLWMFVPAALAFREGQQTPSSDENTSLTGLLTSRCPAPGLSVRNSEHYKPCAACLAVLNQTARRQHIRNVYIISATHGALVHLDTCSNAAKAQLGAYVLADIVRLSSTARRCCMASWSVFLSLSDNLWCTSSSQACCPITSRG